MPPFDYFKVTLHHDGERVVEVGSEALRWPWTTCPDAGVPLRALAGMPLSPRCLAAGDWAPPRMNCTHLFDLAAKDTPLRQQQKANIDPKAVMFQTFAKVPQRRHLTAL